MTQKRWNRMQMRSWRDAVRAERRLQAALKWAERTGDLRGVRHDSASAQVTAARFARFAVSSIVTL